MTLLNRQSHVDPREDPLVLPQLASVFREVVVPDLEGETIGAKYFP